jgi:hypothetical protein
LKRAEWLAEAEVVRSTIRADQARLEELERRIAALDVVLEAFSKTAPQSPIATPAEVKVPSPTSPRALGRAILSWTEETVGAEGPILADELYARLPKALREPFDQNGVLDGAFRFRRLLRRQDKFVVRRRDGLISLAAASAHASERQNPSTEGPHLLVAIVTSSVDGTPTGFLVAGAGNPTTVPFGEVRERIAGGERYAVRGPEGRLSTVEIRNVGFRSIHDGVPNDDIANLQKIEGEEYR